MKPRIFSWISSKIPFRPMPWNSEDIGSTIVYPSAAVAIALSTTFRVDSAGSGSCEFAFARTLIAAWIEATRGPTRLAAVAHQDAPNRNSGSNGRPKRADSSTAVVADNVANASTALTRGSALPRTTSRK